MGAKTPWKQVRQLISAADARGGRFRVGHRELWLEKQGCSEKKPLEKLLK